MTPVNRKNYMLIEFPSMNVPWEPSNSSISFSWPALFRFWSIRSATARFRISRRIVGRFVKLGVRIQVTAMSLTGEFGSSALRCVETLLKNGCVHFIATDTHRAKRRPPVLSEGRDAAAEVVRE